MLSFMATEITLEAPCFLLAVPQSGDTNFVHGVILLIEHDDKGSMGLMVNKPSAVDMKTFLHSIEMQGRPRTEGKVYEGGPVQTDRAFLLHASRHEGPETTTISGEMKLSYSLESLKMLVDDAPRQMRVYLGYAGWGPHQLASEMSAGAWMVAPVDVNLIFDVAPDTIWDTVLRDLGIEPGALVHSGARN
jgi:putative transcriptional regulator